MKQLLIFLMSLWPIAYAIGNYKITDGDYCLQHIMNINEVPGTINESGLIDDNLLMKFGNKKFREMVPLMDRNDILKANGILITEEKEIPVVLNFFLNSDNGSVHHDSSFFKTEREGKKLKCTSLYYAEIRTKETKEFVSGTVDTEWSFWISEDNVEEIDDFFMKNYFNSDSLD